MCMQCDVPYSWNILLDKIFTNLPPSRPPATLFTFIYRNFQWNIIIIIIANAVKVTHTPYRTFYPVIEEWDKNFTNESR